MDFHAGTILKDVNSNSGSMAFFDSPDVPASLKREQDQTSTDCQMLDRTKQWTLSLNHNTFRTWSIERYTAARPLQTHAIETNSLMAALWMYWLWGLFLVV
jgi:hypothetical protein